MLPTSLTTPRPRSPSTPSCLAWSWSTPSSTTPATHAAYDVFQHLALQVDGPADVDRWHAWLVQGGIEVLGPVDHKIIYSIYFHDPNGLRLEITAVLDPTWNDRSDQAHASLAEWSEVKATAAESGRDLVSVLADLTRLRSHRRS
jgi:catechol-2,3-dioxygenase